jgi:hypothetical protein
MTRQEVEMPQRRIHTSHAQRQAAYYRRRQDAIRRQLQEKGLPELPTIATIPGTARWRQAVANAIELLSMVASEMEAYFDDRSEQWQEGERGDSFRERIDALCEARDVVADLSLT